MNELQIYINLINTVTENSPDVKLYVKNVMDYIKNADDMNYFKDHIKNREDIIQELNKHTLRF